MESNSLNFYNLFTELKGELDKPSFLPPGPDVPPEVRLFLGRLALLQGVPPEYLVPDEKLLPKFRLENGEQQEWGSLRFFWLDPAWIECLLDGALSVGPDTDRKLLLTKAMAGNYLAEAFQKDLIERLKQQLAGSYQPEAFKKEMAARMRAKGIAVKGNDFNAIVDPTPAQRDCRFTGFLLRSSLVSGWTGLEIEVKGTDTNEPKIVPDEAIYPLQLVRMEKIAGDTLLCLCEGIIRKIVISQPPEGLHFGLNADARSEGSFTRKFTGISGKTESTRAAVAVPQRTSHAQNSQRVVRIKKSKTGPAGLADLLAATADPADFAMEMIVQPIRNEITVSWEQEKI